MDINITEEQVQAMLSEAVNSYVRQVNDPYKIKYEIDDLIKKSVDDALKAKFDATVRAIVDEFLTGPVDINDGWGSREHYDSYSDFFAKKLREHMANSYSIRNEMRDALKRKVDAAWETFKKEAIQEVLARHAGEETDG